jgi:hypothetical protein
LSFRTPRASCCRASPEIDTRLHAEAHNHLHESRVKYLVRVGYTIFICRGTRMDPIN